MILTNLSSIEAQYRVTQIGSTGEWRDHLPGGCQKVLVLPEGYTYSVVFNALGQQTPPAQNLVPCATVSFTVSNGTVGVSVGSTSIPLKSNAAYLKSMLCDIGNYPKMYLNVEYMNTLSMMQLSVPLLLVGGFNWGWTCWAKRTITKKTKS